MIDDSPRRQHQLLLRLARDLRCRTQMSIHEMEEFAELLEGFKALPESQKDVYRQLMSNLGHAHITVCFPDGSLLEIERSPGHTDVREPGGEWRGTLLHRPLHIIEWLHESMVELVAVGSGEE